MIRAALLGAMLSGHEPYAGAYHQLAVSNFDIAGAEFVCFSEPIIMFNDEDLRSPMACPWGAERSSRVLYDKEKRGAECKVVLVEYIRERTKGREIQFECGIWRDYPNGTRPHLFWRGERFQSSLIDAFCGSTFHQDFDFLCRRFSGVDDLEIDGRGEGSLAIVREHWRGEGLGVRQAGNFDVKPRPLVHHVGGLSDPIGFLGRSHGSEAQILPAYGSISCLAGEDEGPSQSSRAENADDELDASEVVVRPSDLVGVLDRFRRPGLLGEIVYLAAVVLSLIGALATLRLAFSGRDKVAQVLWAATGIGLVAIAVRCVDYLALGGAIWRGY